MLLKVKRPFDVGHLDASSIEFHGLVILFIEESLKTSV